MQQSSDGGVPRIDDSDIFTWDSQNYSMRDASAIFTQIMRASADPWSIIAYPNEFEGRSEIYKTDGGPIVRARSAPVMAAKTTSDVSRSSAEYVYAFCVLSGEIDAEQGEDALRAQQGDLLILDGMRPTKISYMGQVSDRLIIKIPKARYATKANPAGLRNRVIQQDNLVLPLRKCVSFVVENAGTLSKAEISAFYDAIAALVPFSAGMLSPAKEQRRDVPEHSALLQRILDRINQELANPDLTPAFIATEFGISARYVHHMFAGLGVTFTAYVVEKRLSNIKNDLLSGPGRGPDIYTLAYRWGFNDLSTFYRAFNKRFGCTPGQLRKRGY